jgi:hypothetical protein
MDLGFVRGSSMSGLLLLLGGLAAAQPPIAGEVADGAGKPVPGTEIALAFGMKRDGSVPILASATSDDAGRFHLPRLSSRQLEGVDTTGVLWVSKAGLGLGMVDLLRNDRRGQVHRIALEDPAPRRLTLVDDQVVPISGARVALRSVETEATGYLGIRVPDAWLERLSAVTDSKGIAPLPCLSRAVELRSVRVTIPGRGCHVLTIPYAKGKDDLTLSLPRRGKLATRILTEDGTPAAGARVEVWVRCGVPIEGGRSSYLVPERLPLELRRLGIGPDGSIETPAELLRGQICRLVVRADGYAPLVSDWIRLTGETTALPPLRLRRLGTVEGQVVDRTGNPIAGAEVFPPGHELSTVTDSAGRFRLETMRPGRSFLFARKPGFRFHGQPIGEGSSSIVTIRLTRSSERPERLMKTLPDPIPLEESRALARRMLDPILKETTDRGDDAAKLWLLRVLRWLDPPAILEQVEKIKFERGTTADYLKGEAALGIVGIDVEEAISVAETIADPAYRAGTLVDLADEVLSSDRARKLALLDRAATQARAATLGSNKLFQMGEVAEHWLELGERDRARALFADGLKLAEALPKPKRTDAGGLLTHLAWLDPKAPVELLRGVGPEHWHERILANIAIRLAHEHPAEAERLLGEIREPSWRMESAPRICLRVARIDADRARRIASGLPGGPERAYAWTFLALGLLETDPAAARAALDQAIKEIDDRSPDDPREHWIANEPASILPLIERIAPDRVEEVFWRAVALEPPDDDPRDDLGSDSSRYRAALPMLLSRYDRSVASALFEPVEAYVRGLPARAEGNDLTPTIVLALGCIDPRRAVEVVEGLPKARSLSINDPTNWARQTLADHLAMPPDRRWMRLWRFHAGCGISMFEEVYRDL